MSAQNFCKFWTRVALTSEYLVIGCASHRPFYILLFQPELTEYHLVQGTMPAHYRHNGMGDRSFILMFTLFI